MLPFHHPQLLLHLIWLLSFLGMTLFFAQRWRKRRLYRFVSNPLLVTLSISGRRWRSILFFLSVVLIMLALARPYWGFEWKKGVVSSRDILIVLDTSRSMLAKDHSSTAPSRLMHAKGLIRQLLEVNYGDRFGLVTFAGTAYLHCPLTRDPNSFMLFLEHVDTDSMPIGGTNIEEALETALDAFKGSAGANRAVLLMSDGEELQGQAEAVLGSFSKEGIPIFVVGIGDPTLGSYIQKGDKQFVADKEGNKVKSRLNEALLQWVAQKSHGLYVHSTPARHHLDPLIERIKNLVPGDQRSELRKVSMEAYYLPLVLAFFCLLLRILIPSRSRVSKPCIPKKQFMGIILILCTIPGLFAADDLEETIEELKAEFAISTDSRRRSILYYNIGLYHQQLSWLDKARSYYQQAVNEEAVSSRIKARVEQNMGVMKHQQARELIEQKKFDTAIRVLEKDVKGFYQQAIREFPGLKGIGINIEWLLHDLARAKKLKKQQEEKETKQKQANQDKDPGEPPEQDKITEQNANNNEQSSTVERRTLDKRKMLALLNKIMEEEKQRRQQLKKWQKKMRLRHNPQKDW